MLFTRRRKDIYEPDLKLNTHTIDYVKEYKFLGLTFDSKLTWSSHIKEIKAKSTRNLNLIKILSHHTFGYDRELLLGILKSIVLSVIDYGCVIYDTANQALLNSFNTVINSGIRMAIGAFRTSPVNSMMIDSGILPLKYRREYFHLTYGLKIISSHAHPLHENMNTIISDHKMDKMTKRYHSITYRLNKTLDTYNINIDKELFNSKKFNNQPIWTKNNLTFDYELTKYKKDSTPDVIYKKLYLNKINHYKNHYKIYTVGSKIENEIGAAFISNDTKQKIHLPH